MKLAIKNRRLDVGMRQSDALSRLQLLLFSGVCAALASPAFATERGVAPTIAGHASALPSLHERMASERIMNDLLLQTEPLGQPDAERRDVRPSRLTGESANYRVHWDVASGGGGASASASYALVATIGQAAASGFSGSASYAVDSGFLAPPDSDGDGLRNFVDNCLATPNAAQIDSDADRIGNACDADFNNDCIVNAIDLGFLKSVFFSPNDEADLNGDGIVNPGDLGIFKARFFAPPGPSGLANVCSP